MSNIPLFRKAHKRGPLGSVTCKTRDKGQLEKSRISFHFLEQFSINLNLSKTIESNQQCNKPIKTLKGKFL